MEAIIENLWHLWVEKQYCQQCPCPPRCNNNLLVLLKSSVVVDCGSRAVSCHIQCNAKGTNWNCIESMYRVWSVIFFSHFNWRELKKDFLCLSKTSAGYDIGHQFFLSWVLIPKYKVWCFCVFCCPEIRQHYAGHPSRWRKICTWQIRFYRCGCTVQFTAGRRKDPCIWVFALCSSQVRKYVGNIHRSASEHVEYSMLVGNWFHYT